MMSDGIVQLYIYIYQFLICTYVSICGMRLYPVDRKARQDSGAKVCGFGFGTGI